MPTAKKDDRASAAGRRSCVALHEPLVLLLPEVPAQTAVDFVARSFAVRDRKVRPMSGGPDAPRSGRWDTTATTPATARTLQLRATPDSEMAKIEGAGSPICRRSMANTNLRCPAARGRAVRTTTVLQLVAAAGGWCQKPGCPTGFLWHELPDGGAVRMAQVAHIVAASDDGPRGDAGVSTSGLVAFENLILLCPTCHVVVDGAPEHYPTELLKSWKSSHEGRLRALLGVDVFPTRAAARSQLQRLLAQNRQVWSLYGPDAETAHSPESSTTWLREVREVILPNNTRISAMLETNAHLLLTAEHEVVAQFDAHRRALEARHFGVDVGVVAPRFPAQVEALFVDGTQGDADG